MILYDEPLKIEFEEGKVVVNNVLQMPRIRKAKEMQEVYSAKLSCPADEEMYYMFRNIHSSGSLSYDITIIPQKMIGNEYAKTYGHYHPMAENDLSYPEVYHVLRGNGAFVLQKKNPDLSVSVIIVKANAGDVVLVPSNFGHVTVNLSEDVLIVGNLVSTKFQSEYEEYKKYKGAAMYYTTDGTVHNTNHLIIGVQKLTPQALRRKYGFECEDLLKEFHADPKKFEFLNKPSLMFMPGE